jgi:apolipoprotein N-acyltransferase
MRYLPFMKKLALNFGGITGTYGMTPADSLFINPPSQNVFAAICYESVFGDFVASKVRDGANWLAICTNDGWWGHTQGHLQHLHYARLRAIETNRFVVRSANTGISAIIDPNGRIHQQTSYWKEDAFRGNIQMHEDQTFYVRYQGIITILPLIASLAFLLFAVFHVKK